MNCNYNHVPIAISKNDNLRCNISLNGCRIDRIISMAEEEIFIVWPKRKHLRMSFDVVDIDYD